MLATATATALLLLGAGAPRSGWMADPEPAAPQPPPAAIAPAIPAAAARPALPPVPPNSDGPATPPAAAPRLYRMPDASGQAWESADPAALRAFVAARNAQFAAPAYRLAPASPCATGRCPR